MRTGSMHKLTELYSFNFWKIIHLTEMIIELFENKTELNEFSSSEIVLI